MGMSENRSPAEGSVWKGLEAEGMATNGWKNLIRLIVDVLTSERFVISSRFKLETM